MPIAHEWEYAVVLNDGETRILPSRHPGVGPCTAAISQTGRKFRPSPLPIGKKPKPPKSPFSSLFGWRAELLKDGRPVADGMGGQRNSADLATDVTAASADGAASYQLRLQNKSGGPVELRIVFTHSESRFYRRTELTWTEHTETLDGLGYQAGWMAGQVPVRSVRGVPMAVEVSARAEFGAPAQAPSSWAIAVATATGTPVWEETASVPAHVTKRMETVSEAYRRGSYWRVTVLNKGRENNHRYAVTCRWPTDIRDRREYAEGDALGGIRPFLSRMQLKLDDGVDGCVLTIPTPHGDRTVTTTVPPIPLGYTVNDIRSTSWSLDIRPESGAGWLDMTCSFEEGGSELVKDWAPDAELTGMKLTVKLPLRLVGGQLSYGMPTATATIASITPTAFAGYKADAERAIASQAELTFDRSEVRAALETVLTRAFPDRPQAISEVTFQQGAFTVTHARA